MSTDNNGGSQCWLWSNWYVANARQSMLDPSLASRVLCIVVNSVSSCFSHVSASSDRILLSAVFSGKKGFPRQVVAEA